MKVYVVYGPPCGGKSTYIKDNAGKDDIIWDFDKVLCAITTRELHTTDDHPAKDVVNHLRKDLVDNLIYYNSIETLWFQCRWPYDYHMELFEDCDVEKIAMIPTKDECLERLEADDTRPDKEAWKEVIEQWYEEHEEQDGGGENKVTHKNKFWNWITKDADTVLRLEGPIDEEVWWGDECTPDTLRAELDKCNGDLTVWLNSPGGNVFAAAQIYNMLRDYNGQITVKIDALAASAASVIAMAGDKVLISPVAMMMIHNPSTIALGDRDDFAKVIEILDEIRESIINAYQIKTGMSHKKIADMMDAETWLNAKKAVELGFADEILFEEDDPEEEPEEKPEDRLTLFGSTPLTEVAAYFNNLKPEPEEQPEPEIPDNRKVSVLKARLEVIDKLIRR